MGIGGQFSMTMAIVSLIFLLIGAAIFALLHGIGFSVFGFKDIKPTYKKRYLIQILAIVVSYVIFWVAGKMMGTGGLMVLLSSGLGPMLLFIGILSAALVHGSLAVVTYAFVTKPDWKPAFQSPAICSGLTLVVFLAYTLMIGVLIGQIEWWFEK